MSEGKASKREREEESATEPSLNHPGPGEPRCEVCGTRMYELHCELICPNCGYRRDCSDP